MYNAMLPSSHLVDLDHVKAHRRQIRYEFFCSGNLPLNTLDTPRSNSKMHLWWSLQKQILQRPSDGFQRRDFWSICRRSRGPFIRSRSSSIWLRNLFLFAPNLRENGRDSVVQQMVLGLCKRRHASFRAHSVSTRLCCGRSNVRAASHNR